MNFKFTKLFRSNIRMLRFGQNLLFIKFLNEHLEQMETIIQLIPKEVGIIFLEHLESLIFEKNSEEQNIKHLENIVNTIFHYYYENFFCFEIVMDHNLSREYLYENFDKWWYQSLFLLKGSGYIRNINDYCDKFLILNKDHVKYSPREVRNSLNVSYNISNVPPILTKEKLEILKKINESIEDDNFF